MKKLLALILALLMTTLIFASCNTGGEEKSSEPVSEVSSVEISSVEVSSKEEQSEGASIVDTPDNLLTKKAAYDPSKEQVLFRSGGYYVLQSDGVIDQIDLKEGEYLECYTFANNRIIYATQSSGKDGNMDGKLISRDLKTGEETVIENAPVTAVAADDTYLYYHIMGEVYTNKGRFVKRSANGEKVEFPSEYGLEYVPQDFILRDGTLYYKNLHLYAVSVADWKQPKEIVQPGITYNVFQYALAPEGVICCLFDSKTDQFAFQYLKDNGQKQTIAAFDQLEDQQWLAVYKNTVYYALDDVIFSYDLQSSQTKVIKLVPGFYDAKIDEKGNLLVSSMENGKYKVVCISKEELSSAPISYTKEDEQYFNQYTRRLFLFPVKEFDRPDDLSANDLRWIYTFIYDFFPRISDDFGAKYEREDGLFYIPLQDMVTELEKFLGENFEEKLKTHPEYDAKSDCIIVPTFGGLGGAYSVRPVPVPIRREGENVILPLYFYEEEGYSKITTAIEYTIYEFDGGFYLRRCKYFTEDEIADLNEKYFGEA